MRLIRLSPAKIANETGYFSTWQPIKRFSLREVCDGISKMSGLNAGPPKKSCEEKKS